MNRTFPALAATGVLLALAACSGSSGPDGGGAPALGDGEVPAGFTDYSTGAVAVQAPEDFEQLEELGVEGETCLHLRSEPSDDGLRAAVVVLLVAEPEAAATAESENLAEVVREVNGVQDVEREQVTWQDSPAWLVRWEGPAGRGSDVTVHSQTLVADLADGRLLTATAQAPPELFEEYQLDQTLPTVQVSGG